MTAATFVACLTACINPKQVSLESNGTVTGRVIDAVTEAPIAAATLHDEVDRQTMADPDGAFAFTLPSGKHTLLIHADGYNAQQVTVSIPVRATSLINRNGYIRMQRAQSQ